MSICVEIEVDDQGKVSVGIDPEQKEPNDNANMQPAASIDEALAKAKQLLSQGGGQNQAEQQFQQGFKQAGPAPMQPKSMPPQGPMGG